MPPKAAKPVKVKVDGCAKLQQAHHNPALFLVNQYMGRNMDPTAEANIRSFMQERDPMSDEFLMHQDILQEGKTQEMHNMILALLLSVIQKHSGEESSGFLMQILMLCEQFQKHEKVSRKTLHQLLTESSLPENMKYVQDGFIPHMLDKMKHYMSEWLRLAYVKLHLAEKREEHRDIILFCQMVLAVEKCRQDVIVILPDTTATPDERLSRIRHVCDEFHSCFTQPRALALFQQSVGCYIPTKADIDAILDAIDRLGITTVIDLFCGRALFVAILRMYTDIPIIGCDIELHDPFVTEDIRQYEAHEFVQKYLKKAQPDEKLLLAMVWPPSENHLRDSKIDHDDLASQDRILYCRDSRIGGVVVVSDKTDYNITRCDRGTVIGSERSEDLLNKLELYHQIHSSEVPPMNTGVFQPCTPVCTWLSVYQPVHKE